MTAYRELMSTPIDFDISHYQMEWVKLRYAEEGGPQGMIYVHPIGKMDVSDVRIPEGEGENISVPRSW